MVTRQLHERAEIIISIVVSDHHSPVVSRSASYSSVLLLQAGDNGHRIEQNRRCAGSGRCDNWQCVQCVLRRSCPLTDFDNGHGSQSTGRPLLGLLRCRRDQEVQPFYARGDDAQAAVGAIHKFRDPLTVTDPTQRVAVADVVKRGASAVAVIIHSDHGYRVHGRASE